MAFLFSNSTTELEPWIRDEVDFPGELVRENQGASVRRLQEWLYLQGQGVVIDGDFGPATERAVEMFQTDAGIPVTGLVDVDTWWELTRPLWTVLQMPPADGNRPLNEAALTFAHAHLSAHPREVGGFNCGPWVRLYMSGAEGKTAPWCAGFMTFLLQQASDLTGLALPLAGSTSCDRLAEQAVTAGLFLDGADVTPEQILPGSLFLVRQTTNDWTHTGMVTEEPTAEFFSTIEGNTNDAGDREGYEVCARTRSYEDKDFILL